MARSAIASVARHELARKLLVVLLALVAVALGVLGQRQFVDEVNETSGLLYWAGAIVFFIAALRLARSLVGGSGEQAQEVAERPLSLRVEAGLGAVVLAVGIFFRFYRIEDIPPGLNNDAARNGLGALDLTPVVSFFTEPYIISGFGHSGWGKESLFLQIITVFQSFLGREAAVEAAAITAGIATLIAVYFLVRRLFDPHLALVTTFLLGVSGWHVTFSRVGWRSILLPLFAALLFYFLTKAVQERRLRDFVIAGVLLGLSMHTYNAARILPVIVFGYLVYEARRQPALFKTYRWQLAAFAAMALAVFAPLGWYSLNNWSVFNARSESLWIGSQIESAGSLEPLFTNIKNTVLLFNFRANGNDFFVWEPLLDLPVAVFFPLGLVLAVGRFKERGLVLVLLMFVLTLAIGIVSRPDGNRLLLTVIPVTVFSALFLVEGWRWLRWAFPGYSALVSVLLVAILLYTAYDTYDSYLGPDRREQFGFTPGATRVARFVDGISDDYQVIILAGGWPLGPLDYLTVQDRGSVYRMREVSEVPGIRPSPGQSTALVVDNDPMNRDVIAGLLDAYPGADVEIIYYPDDSDIIAAYALLFPDGAPILDTFVQLDGAAGRDGQRRDDLLEISSVLEEYENTTGFFPATDGEVQAGCIHDGIDALCVIAPILRDSLVDPRGDGQHGYWYWSDGSSFTLFALFEQPLRSEDRCSVPNEPAFAGRDDIYCVTGG